MKWSILKMQNNNYNRKKSGEVHLTMKSDIIHHIGKHLLQIEPDHVTIQQRILFKISSIFRIVGNSTPRLEKYF